LACFLDPEWLNQVARPQNYLSAEGAIDYLSHLTGLRQKASNRPDSKQARAHEIRGASLDGRYAL